ncbi:hypothetical protein Vretimale_14013 [Volvox reticuliferus]|uniref:Uncharacterized protein n=1 Tax=Volvox reticuliferus TaxID=1737510 RepID=A0A8J4GLM4_9CHLO|nr:hypothetical protein Vretifemale_20103 [Volvox reticuliferus]GIM10460.1 hypothetical protein Vretimale_14013 [Volvox reticuliferus]
MDAAAAGRVLAAVQAQARRSNAVRRVAARLSYDVIVVLCGVRPAFLLDYAPLPLECVLAVAQAGAEAAGTEVAVLTLDGCHLVGRVDELLQHLTALQQRHPQHHPQPEHHQERSREQQALRWAEGPQSEASVLAEHTEELAAQDTAADGGGVSTSRCGNCLFVAFLQRGGPGMEEQERKGLPPGTGMPPQMRQDVQSGAYVLPPSEAQMLTAQLNPLQRALQALAYPAAATAAATAGPISSNATAASAVIKAHHIHLDGLPDLPLQPTLQGLLLGYPVVYYVRSRDEAAVASRCLAMQGLMLHRVVAPPGGQLEAMLSNVCSDGGRTVLGSGSTAHGHDGFGTGGSGRKHQQRQHRSCIQAQLPERDLETLCGFSVPRSLAGEARVAVAVREWHARLTARLAVAGNNRATALVQSKAAPGYDGVFKNGAGEEGCAHCSGGWFPVSQLEVEEHLTPSVVL